MTTLTRPSPLRARRLLRGATLHDVAREVGVHATTVSLLERGQRPLTPLRLERLAALYATTAARLEAEMARWQQQQARLSSELSAWFRHRSAGTG